VSDYQSKKAELLADINKTEDAVRTARDRVREASVMPDPREANYTVAAVVGRTRANVTAQADQRFYETLVNSAASWLSLNIIKAQPGEPASPPPVELVTWHLLAAEADGLDFHERLAIAVERAAEERTIHTISLRTAEEIEAEVEESRARNRPAREQATAELKETEAARVRASDRLKRFERGLPLEEELAGAAR